MPDGINIPIIVSKLAPPGNKPKMRERFKHESLKSFASWLAAIEDTRPFYQILIDRDGNRVEFWRGWSGLSWAEQIAEAFPGKCSECVGEVENGKVNPDGTHAMRFGTSRPEFYRTHLPCFACRARRRAECISRILAEMQAARVTVADLMEYQIDARTEAPNAE